MKATPFILLTAILSLPASAVADTGVPETERNALVDLYHATDGDNWTRNRNWLVEPDVCVWQGVTCTVTPEGRSVRILRLTGINLKGPLPSSIGNLQHLYGLWLDGNRLTGPIPESVADLQQLVLLVLNDNRLSGPLPASLANLERIEFLLLQNNALEGPLPAEIINDLSNPDSEAGPVVDLSGNRLSGELPNFSAAGTQGRISELNLANNAFQGVIPASWHLLPLSRLDLSGNQFATALPDAWSDFETLRELGLGSLGWTGAIPDLLAQMSNLEALDLSHNQFTGPLPDWLTGLSLNRLHLQGNSFSGSIDLAVAAMNPDGTPAQLELNLADNAFDGAIPEALMSLDFAPANSAYNPLQVPLAALNVCWNDFEQPDDDMAGFLQTHHEGAGLAGCMQRQRLALDPSISGSWYQPERSGEGIVQHLLPGGRLMLYVFTFSDLGNGSQAWSHSTVETGENRAEFETMHALGIDRSARARIDRLADRRQHFVYSHRHHETGGMGFFGSTTTYSTRYDQNQLTRLAGTTCDNRQPHQGISGLWREPATDEGFIVEVIENGQGVVYWFTALPNSTQQAWMMGSGNFDGNVLHIEALVQPVGGVPGPDFDPDQVDRIAWGELTLEFFNHWDGEARWDSLEYGSGSQPLRRLTQPVLAECESQ